MNKLSIIAVGLALTMGCGKKAGDKLVSGMEDFKSKMCACKDKACADKVHDDEKKWEEGATKGLDEKSIPKDQAEKLDKLDDEMRTCRHKFDAPEPAPAAGGDGAGAAPAAGGDGSAAGSAAPAATP
jgi:hypothetical protein